MPNKSLEAIELALNNIDSTAEKLVIFPDDIPMSYTNENMNILIVDSNFDLNEVLPQIVNAKLIGIANTEKFNITTLTKLINTLRDTNEATIVSLNTSPVNCKVIYPTPEVGFKCVFGNYEYSYGQGYWSNSWRTKDEQNGWGVKTIDNTQADYASPLTMIKGYPITNMSGLFMNSLGTTLNLIDWDTSNVTDMNYMFYGSQATEINDLCNFNTSNVNNMEGMFTKCKVKNVDLSKFVTTNVVDVTFMFFACQIDFLTLCSFSNSCMTRSHSIFSHAKIKNLTVNDRAEANQYLDKKDLSRSAHITILNPVLA